MSEEPPASKEPSTTLAPIGVGRSRILGLFGAFVVFQLLMPLTYYVRDDPYDERFAWRMFSAVRLHSCRPTAADDEGEGFRDVNLTVLVHQAWINHMARNRVEVISAYLQRRCDEVGVSAARVVNQCANQRGEAIPDQVYTRECSTGTLEIPEPLSASDE